MNENLRILVIEDNMDIAENIADFFEDEGHTLDFASEGIGGLYLALNETFDVIILDLMMPGMDGLTLCRKLREEADAYTPVLMLTARDTLDDKLTGFESGADDYLVKPFALEELDARVKALVRMGKNRQKQTTLTVADLELNPHTQEVKRNGVPIALGKIRFQLLKILMKASPGVVTRKDLEYALWGDSPPGSDALRTHLYKLRNKIDKPFDSNLIHTVHGVGFKIDE